MVVPTGESIFTDIEESEAIYRWRLHWGGKRCLQVKQDQTFTDDWEGTRCLPTSNKDVYRHQGKNTFMKRNHLPMAKMKHSIFTDSESAGES
jgi:hypothetical protein